MKSKPVIPRAAAYQDVDPTIDYYLSEDAGQVALNFTRALELAYRHISRHPTAGSPRYAYALDLPGLRCWPLRRFPYLVFYIEQDEHIDVWRVLHGQRDIPERMTGGRTWISDPVRVFLSIPAEQHLSPSRASPISCAYVSEHLL